MTENNGGYLTKIADWDLLEEPGATEAEGLDAALYRQLKSYFRDHFTRFETVERVSGQLKTVLGDFREVSAQIEQVAGFLKKGSERQTEDIERCISLIDSFTGKINGMYESTQNIIGLAYEMEKANNMVQESVGELVTNQEKNDEAVQSIFRVIKNLMQKTQRIGEVTALIDRIASEINLLGLNAKIEAVHAGTAGSGFAVVANEIQRLAEESRAASGNISDTIKSVTDEIGMLEKVAQKSQDTFSAQRESVCDVSRGFEKNTEFIKTYIGEQKSFSQSIGGVREDESILVNAISSIFGSVREVTATAHEISSLTYNENNAISLLSKLQTDLSQGVGAIREADGMIRVERIVTPKKRVAFMFDIVHEFFKPTEKDAKKAAGTYNFDVSFFAPRHRGEEGVREMAALLDRIIEDKYDGLVISPVDGEAVYQRLRTLNRMGTKIVFINSKIDGVDYVSLIQTDGLLTGSAAAHVAMGILGNSGEVIVNSWMDAQISAIENRKNGFVQELRRASKLTVHQMDVKSAPTAQEAEQFIEATLKRHPAARVMYLTNCDWGVIAARYKKKSRVDFQIITVDFMSDIRDLMYEGIVNYAIGQRAYSWGSMSLGFLDSAFAGQPVVKYVDTKTYEVNLQNIKIYESILQ